MIYINLICKGRGQGKTYDLILESARTGIPILTPYPTKHIISMAKEIGQCIPEPIYIDSYLRNCRGRINFGGEVLIDEIDGVLEKLLHVQVKTATLTQTLLTEKENNIMVKYENTATAIACPKITDVNIIKPKQVVEVTFADGTKTKSVCRYPDVFSLEQAIAICIGKKIMGGSSVYNNAIKRGLKVYDDKLKKEEIDKAEQERIANKRAKRIAYKKRKVAEREQAEKERQIEIQKEAYIRAMEYMQSVEDKGVAKEEKDLGDVAEWMVE